MQTRPEAQIPWKSRSHEPEFSHLSPSDFGASAAAAVRRNARKCALLVFAAGASKADLPPMTELPFTAPVARTTVMASKI